MTTPPTTRVCVSATSATALEDARQSLALFGAQRRGGVDDALDVIFELLRLQLAP